MGTKVFKYNIDVSFLLFTNVVCSSKFVDFFLTNCSSCFWVYLYKEFIATSLSELKAKKYNIFIYKYIITVYLITLTMNTYIDQKTKNQNLQGGNQSSSEKVRNNQKMGYK